jgi:hypothetical protein
VFDICQTLPGAEKINVNKTPSQLTKLSATSSGGHGQVSKCYNVANALVEVANNLVEKPLRSNSPGINSGSSSNLLDE